MKPLAGLALLATLANASRARAEVTLELAECGLLSEAQLREHLSLELATLGLDRAQLGLRLRCEGSRVTAEVVRSSGAPYPTRARVELQGTAIAERERLVVLAASELIAQAERAEPEPTTKRPVAAAARPDHEHARESVERVRRPARELFIAANTAWQGSSGTTLWGGALGARLALRRSLLVLLDTRLERGSTSVSLADVRWSSLSGFAGLGLGTELSRLQLSMGAGVRAGWLALEASAHAPNDGASVTAPWAGVALPVRAAFGDRFRPFIGAEAGWIFLPVRGSSTRGQLLLAQRGAWFSGSVGVGVSL